MRFTIGAEVTDAEGPCGELIRIVVDPQALCVTHLVVEPKHRLGLGRLVPVDLVEMGSDRVHLGCDRAAFEALPAAEDVRFVAAADDFPGEGLVEPVVDEAVPQGRVTVGERDPVYALDGEIGRLHGVITSGVGHRVTDVVLHEGHLLRRKDVTIPAATVTGVGDGVQLNLTREQIEQLPAEGEAGRES